MYFNLFQTFLFQARTATAIQNFVSLQQSLGLAFAFCGGRRGSWVGASFTKTHLCSTSSELYGHDSKSRPIKSRCSHHSSAGDSTLAYKCIKISCIKNISHPKLVSMNLNLYGRLISVLGREGTVDLAKGCYNHRCFRFYFPLLYESISLFEHFILYVSG